MSNLFLYLLSNLWVGLCSGRKKSLGFARQHANKGPAKANINFRMSLNKILAFGKPVFYKVKAKTVDFIII